MPSVHEDNASRVSKGPLSHACAVGSAPLRAAAASVSRVSRAASASRRGGSTRSRSGSAVAALMLVWLLFVPASGLCASSARDSTGVGGRRSLADWLPHGNYQTSYNVNRTVQTWSQTFSMPYTVGKLQVNSNVMYSYSTDSNNGRKTIGRTARTSFNYLPLEGLKLGLSLDLMRNSMETPTIDASTRTERDKVLLTGEYSFSPIDGMTTSISGKTGGVDEFLENRTVERSGRGRDSSFDFTNTYKPWQSLSWSVRMGGGLTALDSEDSKTGLRTKDRNIQESYNTTLSYKPGQGWGLNLSLGRMESQFQYPKEDAQETKSGAADNFSVGLTLKPVRNLSLDLSAKSNRTVIDFDIERIRSTTTETKSFSGNLNYELFGAKIESRLNWEDKRSEYGSGPDVPVSVTSQAGYLYVRSLTGSVSRSLGPKLEAKAMGSITLRSYQFDDTENNPDDRDILNRTLSFELDYTPSPKYRAGLGFARRMDMLVYVDSRKSTNTREGETYTVTADFTYNMSPTTSISQNTRMNADYSFYKYSESRNLLIRSTTLHTVLRTKLLRKVGIALVHDYRYQDQGGVTREGGRVYYGKTGNNDRQDMTVKVNYEPVKGVKIAVSQRFQADKRFSIDNDERTLTSERDRVELLAGVDVKYKLSDGTNVEGKFERTDSTAEGKYWRVTATFKRSF